MCLFPKKIAAMLVASFVLIGCGGGETSAAGGGTSFTGKFVDATVAGMAYRCGSSATNSGLTTANGEYTCPTGQSVAFYVGDIFIGSVSTPMAVITPLDLVGANASPSNTTVMNIVRFLMSISSTNPTTGTITIDPAVATAAAGKSADFSVGTPTVLDALIATIKPGATVATTTQATAHVASSINGLFAGNYSGAYGGSSSGNWSLTIDANGGVSGTSDRGAIVGSMAMTLSTGSTYGFTGSAGGVPWTGTLNISTKVFSGTWDDGAGSSGTFTGSVAAAAPAAGAPTITSFTPASGAVGTAIAVTGTSLASVTQVLFTGPSPSTAFVGGAISAQAATSITTAVPSNLAAGSYTVSVVYPGGEVAAVTALMVTAGGSTGVGAGAGLTITPDFNGMATFADRTPSATSAEAGQTSLLWNEGYPTLRRIVLTHDAATKAGNTTGGELIFVQVVNFSASISLNTGVYGALQCAQGATSGSSPTCASLGIVFDKASGTVTFTNMPLTDAVLSSGATTARTMSGTLTFTPFM